MSDYVLVHGAYQGGWIWQRVAARLRAEGHTAYAPTLDGCAERHHVCRPDITLDTHGREVAQLLFYEDLRDVTLVGTSAGGRVICRAAELARERIGRLVFVDALALLPGERVAEIVQRRTPYETSGSATGPSRADAERRLFADLTPKDRSWALARYTLHPRAALEDPVKLDTFWEQAWSATVVRCRRSVNPPDSHQRRTAERLKATWIELDAGHYPMLTHTDELTQILLSAS